MHDREQFVDKVRHVCHVQIVGGSIELVVVQLRVDRVSNEPRIAVRTQRYLCNIFTQRESVCLLGGGWLEDAEANYRIVLDEFGTQETKEMLHLESLRTLGWHDAREVEQVQLVVDADVSFEIARRIHHHLRMVS